MKKFAIILERNLSGKIVRKLASDGYIKIDGRLSYDNATYYAMEKTDKPFLICIAESLGRAIDIAEKRLESREYGAIEQLFKHYENGTK